jgi:hypothetical protein
MVSYRYSGRDFSITEIESIRKLIADNPKMLRQSLSRNICRMFKWHKPNGELKEMSCRVAMLRMDKDALIKLPLPKHENRNGKRQPKHTNATDPQFPIGDSVGKLVDLEIKPITNKKQSALWNEYINRYHYLGFKMLPGAQLRYMVYANSQVISLLGFGASAWMTAPRDKYIGWTHDERKKNLQLVVNNCRFLILPWIRSKNLGSKILSMIAKRIGNDWYERYKYRPVLLETFVQKNKFTGAVYKASNWQYLGETKGRGKLEKTQKQVVPIKTVWVYPLIKDFRTPLTN